MRAVNLLPRQQVQQKRERSTKNPVPLVGAIGGAVVVLALAGGFFLANRSVDRQQQALTNAKAVLAATPAKKTSAKTQAFRADILSQREERSLALAAALGKRVAWDRLLRHIALVLPSDVWLNGLTGNVSLQSTVPAGTTTPSPIPAAPTALLINGYTYSQEGVAQLLSRLQVLPDLKNVQLQSSATTKVGSQNVISFTIAADIRDGGGAS